MIDREKIIKEWESVLSRDPLDAPWDLIDETLALLKEHEASTLGMKITADGITFTAEGDAKQGEQRGLLLGKTMMLEHIEKELLYENLLTDEVRAVLDRVKRRLISDS